MLFDPSSGSMVAVPSRDDPSKSSTKKTKATKGPQKSPAAKRSDEGGKINARRPLDGSVTNESSDSKLPRGKQGKGSRKDEATALQQKNKKSIDSNGRSSHRTPRKRVPRTRGVMYKMDKSGNFVNVDGCDPDNGYGAHRVPGGKVKNSPGYAKLTKKEEDKKAAGSQPPSTDNETSPAVTEGFSFRNDPGFLQHQTNFEAQQQKTLEDAWASLVENEEPKGEAHDEVKSEKENGVPVSKSGDDEYAAALAMEIGLNFDTSHSNIDSVMLPLPVTASAEEPIDLANFAFQAASSATSAQPSNPFSPLGVSSVGLWGTGTDAASASLGDLGTLTGWGASPFNQTENTSAAKETTGLGLRTSASKLALWGGGFDELNQDEGLGSIGDTPNGAD